MVKGVNKRIIEVVGSDKDYFEKAILFMKPENVIKSKIVTNKETDKYVNNISNNDIGVGNSSNLFMYVMTTLFGSFCTLIIMFLFFL